MPVLKACVLWCLVVASVLTFSFKLAISLCRAVLHAMELELGNLCASQRMIRSYQQKVFSPEVF